MKLVHGILMAILFHSLSASPVRADVKLPAIFGDHMVLQQEAKLPVWGTADVGEKITVTVRDHSASTTTGADGKWRVDLAPFPNGMAPTTMTVAGKNTLTFQDVLIGDVWLASGQSNMEYATGMTLDSHEETSGANDAQLRLFLVSKVASLHPLTDVFSPCYWTPQAHAKFRESDGDHPGTWLVCDPHTADVFSAVAYFFGRELRSHLNRPIGVIGDYWGGTAADPWISLDGLQKEPPFQSYISAYQQNLANYPQLKSEYDKAYPAYLAALKDYEQKRDEAALANLPHPSSPSSPEGGAGGPANLFNGMIAPLIPYAIKGVIWYQGESNRTKAEEYRTLFPRLIADWREKWGQGNFPFLYVQISHVACGDEMPSLIREAQLKALALPETGMAVTVDIPCDDGGVHPHDKIDPAKRLALVARHVAYGENLVYSGPLYQSMKVEGSTIRISFNHVGSGLMIGRTPYQPPAPVVPLPRDKLVGFTIAGIDKKFVPAEAKIDGNTLIVSSAEIPNPIAVRFAWGNVVQDNLYNQENLPASPFRTDEGPLLLGSGSLSSSQIK